ncbi:MAG: hypothetical protein E7440_05240 [Ruminococcaceae bacterium]|nr:hypothetical protein [Oscillospiraceae bacterium]
MKASEKKRWPGGLSAGVALFLILLPMDFTWSLPFVMIKAAINGVSAVVYAGILHAMWERAVAPGEHGGLLFVLGLVTLPYLLLLTVFYYNGLICAAVSAGLAVALLTDLLRSRKKKE